MAWTTSPDDEPVNGLVGRQKQVQGEVAHYRQGPNGPLADLILSARDKGAIIAWLGIPDAVNNPPREEVLAFAGWMEKKLRSHDTDYGDAWKEWNTTDCVAALYEHADKLAALVFGEEEFTTEPDRATRIDRAAADVANFCLFAAFLARKEIEGRKTDVDVSV